MNRKILSILGGVFLSLGIVLAACQPARQASVEDVSPPSDFTYLRYEARDCSYGGLFKSMEALDAYTVRFTLCSPEPAFLAKIAFGAFGIYPKEFLAKYAGTPTLLEKPVGTGPYLVSQWKRGEELDLKRFDGYWGEAAKTPNLIFRWSADASQRLSELRAGSIDGFDNVSSSDFAIVQKDGSLKLILRPALNIFYLGMNNTVAPFDKEKVRQAIAMGIDRARIVRSYFPAGSEVASYFTPCSIPNGCTGEVWYDFNPVRARQLLTEAGFPNGFNTVIDYRDVTRSYLEQPGAIALELQAQLKANLNINARLEVVDKTTFLDLANAGLLRGIHLLGWSSDYPDITDFLDFHFGIGSSDQFGKKWQDITDPLNFGSSFAETLARRPYYEAANNAIKQHVPAVPVAHGGSALVFKKSVEGAYSSPVDMENFAVMSTGSDTMVFMQTEEPGSLYCNDETDGDSFRPCSQIVETLYRYKLGGVEVEPSLAIRCEPNEILTEWTCDLRRGVKFQDGSLLDAGDVVTSLDAAWDAASPLHKGSTSDFGYWYSLWGNFLNQSK